MSMPSPAGDVVYLVTFTLRGRPRLSPEARRQEPREIGGFVLVAMAGLADMGLEFDGDISVRQIAGPRT